MGCRFPLQEDLFLSLVRLLLEPLGSCLSFPCQFPRVCQAAAQGTGLLLAALASSCLWAGDLHLPSPHHMLAESQPNEP